MSAEVAAADEGVDANGGMMIERGGAAAPSITKRLVVVEKEKEIREISPDSPSSSI